VKESAPDAVRRPISMARLAESLGQPYETVRGHAHRLVTAGVCRRADHGLIVPAVVLEQPVATRALVANVANVRKLVRDLNGFAESERADRPKGDFAAGLANLALARNYTALDERRADPARPPAQRTPA
jgi:hypothetical protein